MRVNSYMLIKNNSYMVFYDTVLNVEEVEVPCHFLVYIQGSPRDLLSLYKEHKNDFSMDIYYVMDNPSIFSNHSQSVCVNQLGQTLYKFIGIKE